MGDLKKNKTQNERTNDHIAINTGANIELFNMKYKTNRCSILRTVIFIFLSHFNACFVLVSFQRMFIVILTFVFQSDKAMMTNANISTLLENS